MTPSDDQREATDAVTEADYTPTMDQMRSGYINGIFSIKRDVTDADKVRRGQGFDRALAAHDAALVAATHAQQYAATRTAIIRALIAASKEAVGEHGAHVDEVEAPFVADALLATPGPLMDAAEVWERAVAMCCEMLGATNVNWPNPYREARP